MLLKGGEHGHRRALGEPRQLSFGLAGFEMPVEHPGGLWTGQMGRGASSSEERSGPGLG